MRERASLAAPERQSNDSRGVGCDGGGCSSSAYSNSTISHCIASIWAHWAMRADNMGFNEWLGEVEDCQWLKQKFKKEPTHCNELHLFQTPLIITTSRHSNLGPQGSALRGGYCHILEIGLQIIKDPLVWNSTLHLQTPTRLSDQETKW
jgi:hypothetical protein